MCKCGNDGLVSNSKLLRQGSPSYWSMLSFLLTDHRLVSNFQRGIIRAFNCHSSVPSKKLYVGIKVLPSPLFAILLLHLLWTSHFSSLISAVLASELSPLYSWPHFRSPTTSCRSSKSPNLLLLIIKDEILLYYLVIYLLVLLLFFSLLALRFTVI